MDKARILDVLQTGEMQVEGLLPWSSNYAFLVTVCGDDLELPAVYKPRRGERPLWDFPQGTLNQRERAAFLISETLGWDLVPPTVLRDGEHGIGSVQLFIEHDPERHYFTFEGARRYRGQLQQMALFDIIINNADRKGGHVLIEETADDDEASTSERARLWGIDHGICFHSDYKLRTVIWEFADNPIPVDCRADLQRLQEALAQPDTPIRRELERLLSNRELRALQRRLERVLERTTFPNPGPGRHYPWPPV